MSISVLPIADARALRKSLGLRARVGIHVGAVTLRENTADEVARGAKPIETEGLAKLLAARIMALPGGGGQTLLSAAAHEALADGLPDDTAIVSHGYYRLKGIEAPVGIFELGTPGASPFTPPADVDKAYRVVHDGNLWRPVREVRHNLPRRARRLHRPKRRAARARRPARRRQPAAHDSRPRGHGQEPFRAPLRPELAGRLARRHLLLRPERRQEPRWHSERRGCRARHSPRQGRSWYATRACDRRARTLRQFTEALSDPRTVLDGYLRRNDFSRWIADVFGDFALADDLRRIEERYQSV